MDNQNNNDDFLYGGNEQPTTGYEEPVVENENITDAESEPQQLPPYGQEANNQSQYYQNPYGQYNYNQNPYGQNAYNPYEQQNKKNTLGIISLVAGILSVICCCLNFYISIVVGITAIVTAIISIKKKEQTKGFAITGLCLGIVAILLGIVLAIIGLYLVSTGVYDQMFNDLSQSLGGMTGDFPSDFPSDLDY